MVQLILEFAYQVYIISLVSAITLYAIIIEDIYSQYVSNTIRYKDD